MRFVPLSEIENQPAGKESLTFVPLDKVEEKPADEGPLRFVPLSEIKEEEKPKPSFGRQLLAGEGPDIKKSEPEKEAKPTVTEGKPLEVGSQVSKGAESGVVGLKSMYTGSKLARDVGAISSAQQSLSTYDAIDKGEITTPAEASKAGLSSQSAMKYLKADPEARAVMRDNFTGQIAQRQDFIKDSLKLYKQYQDEIKAIGGHTTDLTDVRGATDFTNWLAYNVGSGAVQIAPIMIAALTTGGPGALTVGGAMALGETVNNRLEFLGKEIQGKPEAEQAKIVEDYLRKTQDTNLGVAVFSGALDMFGPVGTVLKNRAGKEGIKYFTKKEGIKAAVKEAPKDILKEGATGAGQESIQIAGKRELGEQTGDILSEENVKAVINAAAAEAVGGGVGASANIGISALRTPDLTDQQKADLVKQDVRAKAVIDNLEAQFNINLQKVKLTGLEGDEATRAALDMLDVDAATQKADVDVAAQEVEEKGVASETRAVDTGTGEPSVSVPVESIEDTTGVSGVERTVVGGPSEVTAGTPVGEEVQSSALTIPEDANDRLMQIITEAEQTGNVNVQAINDLATELNIPVSEDTQATAAAIFERINPQPTEVVEEAPVQVTPTEVAAEATQAEVVNPDTGLKAPGKRGRKKQELTPEQVAAKKETKRVQAGASRDAGRTVDRSVTALETEFDPEAFESIDAAQVAQGEFLEARRQALEDLYRVATAPAHKNNTAGKKAQEALSKVSEQERELAKQRVEAKKKVAESTARSELIEATSSEPNEAIGTAQNATQAAAAIKKTGNEFERLLAQRLMPFLAGVKLVIVRDPNVDIPTIALRKRFVGATGMYAETATSKVIYLNADPELSGLNNTTFLHEALHGATMAKINAYLKAIKGKGTIDPRTEAAVRSLETIMYKAYKYYGVLKYAGLTDARTDALYNVGAFTDLKEFVAYGMSQPEMQEFLLQVPGDYKNQPKTGIVRGLLNNFVQSIRRLFNMDESHDSAMQDLIIVTNQVLAAPEVTPSQGEALAKKVTKIDNLKKKLERSNRATELNATIGELMMQVRNANDAIRLLKSVYGSLNVGSIRKILPTLTTEDIIRWAGDRVNNLKNVSKSVESMSAMRTRMIQELAEKVPDWVSFSQKNEQAGRLLADMMHASSLVSVNPTKYKDAATAIQNNKELQKIEQDLLDPALSVREKAALKRERTLITNDINFIYDSWEKLGKVANGKGQEIYKMALEAYKDTFNLHEQLLLEKIAKSPLPQEAKDNLIASITQTFQDARQLEVYFPLMRYGSFWSSVGSGKKGEFYMFETASARNNAIRSRVEELKKAGDKRSMEQMIEDGDIDFGDDINRLRDKTTDSSEMLKGIFEIIDKNGVADPDDLKDSIYQMYLMTLPEKDIRRKFTHRQGKTGFSGDVIRNFIVSQHTAANQLSRLKYSEDIRNAIGASEAELEGNPDKLKLQAFVDEVKIRAMSEITPDVPGQGIDFDKLASIGNQFVFYWLLTSPKSAIVQMTQMPIVGLPMLTAEFGAVDTAKVVARYSNLYKMMGTSKVDSNGDVITEWGQPSINDSKYVNEHPNKAYRQVLKDAWNYANDRDVFMSTYAGDMTSRSRVPTGRYEGLIGKGTRAALNLISGAFHHSERISREIMYMSSFELAYAQNTKKGMSSAEAASKAKEKAMEVVYGSLFNYTQFNKPRVMKSPGGKLAFQFLSYPAQMTSYLIRNFYGMLPLLNKEGKREASIKFFGTLINTGLFAGVTGLPLYSFIIGIAEGMRELMRPGMGDDDEEFADEDYDEDADGNPLGRRSLDLWFRNWFIPTYFGDGSSLAKAMGLNPEQAALLSRSVEAGPISALTDLNFGASTSLDGLWFRNDTPAATSKEAFTNFVFSFTGPFGSIGANIAGAFDDFNNGQMNRGVEKLLPAFARGPAVTARLKQEGLQTKQGDQIMDPEFYHTGKLLAQSLGFASTEAAQVQKSNFLAKSIVTKINGEKTKLLNKLDIAARNGSDEAVDKVLLDIDKFNRKNAMMAINGETISKSLQNRSESRGKSYQGLSVPDKEMPFVYPLVEGTRSPDQK
jgi:hypothetical protein